MPIRRRGFSVRRRRRRVRAAVSLAVIAALLGGGEVLVGVALLSGRRWSMAGYIAVIAFHMALMLFGWGVWLWAVPVLAAVVPSARVWARTLRHTRMRVSPGPQA